MEKEKDGILLESGTNEIEIMKFKIQGLPARGRRASAQHQCRCHHTGSQSFE